MLGKVRLQGSEAGGGCAAGLVLDLGAGEGNLPAPGLQRGRAPL